MFEYHLKPFIAAIKAGTSSMMPYYAKPIKTEFEEVGFAYSKAIITDLLRKKLGFQGIVNSDTGYYRNDALGRRRTFDFGTLSEEPRCWG
jgi:beta-glucosidase